MTERLHERRGFLRGLVSLPLIGGGLTLVGRPSAVAEPVTMALIDRYAEWLSSELGEVLVERTGMREPDNKAEAMAWRREWCRANSTLNMGGLFLVPPKAPPSSRAALVLSAVGCDWRQGT